MAQRSASRPIMDSGCRVGYWWSEKKSRKFNDAEFANVCRLSGLELVKINLEQPLENQGPFDAIVHKLSDFVLKANKGNEKAISICQSFQEFVNNHPEIVVLDPLPGIQKLVDRYSQYKFMEDELEKEGDVFVPAFVELTNKNIVENMEKMTAADVTFPCVCKPSTAHGSTAHEMCLIFNKEGLEDITVPCVVQKFINHNAVLYKVFIIGEKCFMIERPSLKNFSTGDHKTIFFHSHDISKPHSASALTELDESEPSSPRVWPDQRRVNHIVQVLCQHLGLALFGIDIIVDNNTGRYAIVDMNFFPGFDEVDNFFQILCDLIIQRIKSRSEGNYEKTYTTTILNPQGPKFDSVGKSFTFDTVQNLQKSKDVLPFIPQCFCCPTSVTCSNSGTKQSEQSFSCKDSGLKVPDSEPGGSVLQVSVVLEEEKVNDDSAILPCNDVRSSQLHKLNDVADNPFCKSHSPDSAQDDSGIETSDSCDEQKKKPGFRSVRRQHSRNVCCLPSL